MKVGDKLTLFNVAPIDDNIIDNSKTFIGNPLQGHENTLVRIFTGIDNKFSIHCRTGVKPVGRFTVRRLHNNDPITII